MCITQPKRNNIAIEVKKQIILDIYADKSYKEIKKNNKNANGDNISHGAVYNIKKELNKSEDLKELLIEKYNFVDADFE